MLKPSYETLMVFSKLVYIKDNVLSFYNHLIQYILHVIYPPFATLGKVDYRYTEISKYNLVCHTVFGGASLSSTYHWNLTLLEYTGNLFRQRSRVNLRRLEGLLQLWCAPLPSSGPLIQYLLDFKKSNISSF